MFSSKLAVVTGASKGIGATIAKELSENGFTVLLVARNEDGLNQVAGYIQAEGGSAFAVPADITKPEGINQISEFVDTFNGKLNLLVHSAGIARVGRLENFSAENWRNTLETNVTGPFLLTRKLIPQMPKGAQVIFINSVAGRQAFPEWGAYAVSKFALRALADTLRAELAEREVRVTSIFPASVNTSMHDTLPFNWERSKMLRSRDVANAVLYCMKQPPGVRINEIDLENSAGTF